METPNVPDPRGAGASPGSSRAKIDRHEVVRVLGDGAMGRVYLVRDPARPAGPDADAALKLLHKAARLSLTRFQDEVDLLRAISHPHLAAFHRYVEEPDGDCYIMSEYVPGGTLQMLLEAHQRRTATAKGSGGLGLRETMVLEIGRQCAGALAALHAGGITHRAVKPTNILTTLPPEETLRRGLIHVKLVDASLLPTDPRARSPRSLVGAAPGAPLYAAPEWLEQTKSRPVAKNGRSGQPSKPADVFCLGLVLYHLGTGAPLLTTDDALFRARGAALLEACLARLRRALEALRENPPIDIFHPEVAALLLAMLEEHPDRRPTAETVEAKLKLLQKRLDTGMRPPSLAESEAAQDWDEARPTEMVHLPSLSQRSRGTSALGSGLTGGSSGRRPRTTGQNSATGSSSAGLAHTRAASRPDAALDEAAAAVFEPLDLSGPTRVAAALEASSTARESSQTEDPTGPTRLAPLPPGAEPTRVGPPPGSGDASRIEDGGAPTRVTPVPGPGDPMRDSAGDGGAPTRITSAPPDGEPGGSAKGGNERDATRQLGRSAPGPAGANATSSTTAAPLQPTPMPFGSFARKADRAASAPSRETRGAPAPAPGAAMFSLPGRSRSGTSFVQSLPFKLVAAVGAIALVAFILHVALSSDDSAPGPVGGAAPAATGGAGTSSAPAAGAGPAAAGGAGTSSAPTAGAAPSAPGSSQAAPGGR